jgi:hypothetical protein
MRVLRHAGQVVTTEIYANASSAATRDALRQLEDILHSRSKTDVLLYFAAVVAALWLKSRIRIRI